MRVRRRILIDAGEGRPEYVPALLGAMAAAGCSELAGIVITHGHGDHVGGAAAVLAGTRRVHVPFFWVCMLFL